MSDVLDLRYLYHYQRQCYYPVVLLVRYLVYAPPHALVVGVVGMGGGGRRHGWC